MFAKVMITNRHFKDINPRICGIQACKPGHKVGMGEREFWVIHYVVSGQGTFWINGESYSVCPSQVFVIPPGELVGYEADKENPWSYIWIGFESGIELPQVFSQPVFSFPQGKNLFESMAGAREFENGRELYLCSKIFELLHMLLPSEEKEGRRQVYVRQAKNYIKSEYMTGITVGDVAASLSLDRSYFSGLFREEVGKTPKQYLREVRMQQAADHLLNRDYTVTEIAMSVGYPDVFTFSRVFRNHFGMSPREYREKNKS